MKPPLSCFEAPAGEALEAELERWRHHLAARPRRTMEAGAGGRAAVLMPLFWGEEGLSTLFITRAVHLKRHPGQVGLPGGRLEPGESLEACALREAQEEVGLPPGWAHPLGPFDELRSPYGVCLTPFLAYLPQRPTWRVDPNEVASAHEVALWRFLAPGVHASERREVPHTGRVVVHHYRASGLHVWGVTGQVLHDALGLLKEALGGQEALRRPSPGT